MRNILESGDTEFSCAAAFLFSFFPDTQNNFLCFNFLFDKEAKGHYN